MHTTTPVPARHRTAAHPSAVPVRANGPLCESTCSGLRACAPHLPRWPFLRWQPVCARSHGEPPARGDDTDASSRNLRLTHQFSSSGSLMPKAADRTPTNCRKVPPPRPPECGGRRRIPISFRPACGRSQMMVSGFGDFHELSIPKMQRANKRSLLSTRCFRVLQARDLRVTRRGERFLGDSPLCRHLFHLLHPARDPCDRLGAS